jgi:hypothetical protein
MLAPGAGVPDAAVWWPGRAEAVRLADALAGDGTALVCFTPFDWSPT